MFRELREEDPDKAIQRYRGYMQERENDTLELGTGFPLVEALLNLNEDAPDSGPPITEVFVLSQNSPETGVRVLNSIRDHDLDISRSAFTAGASVTDYLDAFQVDLFLTTDQEDAQRVIDSGECAAAVLSVPPDRTSPPANGEVRIALDGDAVLFSDESELVYKQEDLETFHEREDALQDEPLPGGPYGDFLKALAQMQERLSERIEYSPVRLALVTSRDSPAELRAIKTLRDWEVYVDLAFFLGGVDKGPVLEAFNPHIFFDDQDVHVESASEYVPTGKVLYRTDSKLRKLQEERTGGK
ncbi:5'-nucleotidase [Salinibacter sp.]|uniref:5'-nucleotidase n=1 Tax=Salinibacter sp. TaxID=2065818 RepID=UPI00325FBEFC